MRVSITRVPCIVLVLGLLACTSAEHPVDRSLAERTGNYLRTKIDAGRETERFTCRQEILCGSSIIPAFYRRRGYAPAWIGADATFLPADPLVAVIRDAEREGLSPEDYHLATIGFLLADIRGKFRTGIPVDPEEGAALDLLLTDAFLLYGAHLLAGRVDPEILHTDWVASDPSVDLAALLESSLAGDNVATTLRSLPPPDPGYDRLKHALAYYRSLAERGGWPAIPPGDSLQKGDLGERVDLLRIRLAMTGDIDRVPAEGSSLFDGTLEAAVRRFQRRHGLEDDGVVGRETLAALNVPVEDRIRQIELNMERWRWIPHDLGKRHLLVNIPDFRMRVVENSVTVTDMRIIVGKEYMATPVFSGTIRYMQINPSWNIPNSIAVGEILPKIRRDRNYLAKEKIRVFRSWRENAPEIDPATVDWNAVDDRGFSFKLQQEPGPSNPLGRMKFLFPNRFAVYLHDTPAPGLFRNVTRGFSHGCIRVEKPLELAAILLRGSNGYSLGKIVEFVESGLQKTIPLEEPVPVHILYRTAWVDSGGTVQFRQDIYGRDNPLDVALRERPPGTGKS